jgi:hypothetical protein
MAGPLTGYPDFSSYGNQNQPTIIAGTFTIPVGASVLSLGNVGQYASLFIYVMAVSGGVVAQPQFADDSSFTNNRSPARHKIPTGYSAGYICPILGNVAQMAFQNNNAASKTAVVVVSPSHQAVFKPTYFPQFDPFDGNNSALAGNASIVTNVISIFEGRLAGLVRNTGGSTIQYYLQDIDDLGVSKGIHLFTGALSGPSNFGVDCQPSPMQFVIVNESATATTVQYGVHAVRYS